MRLLLDTQIFLWFLGRDQRLRGAAREAVASPENSVLVGAASIWEIAIKASVGRLEISGADVVRLPQLIVASGFDELPGGGTPTGGGDRRAFDVRRVFRPRSVDSELDRRTGEGSCRDGAECYDRAMAHRGLEVGFVLDRQRHWLRGEMEGTKGPALRQLARVLEEAQLAYAIIGGVALQIHAEPRTTLDVDLAVVSCEQIPRHLLEAAGFQFRGRFSHSENWVGPESTPVQFTDDPALAGAIERAEAIDLDGVRLRVIRRVDLLHEKLRAGSDPARRRSKRLQDLADAQALLEADPALASELAPAERGLLDQLPP